MGTRKGRPGAAWIVALACSVLLLSEGPAHADERRGGDPLWEALLQDSRQALASLVQGLALGPVTAANGSEGVTVPDGRPRMVVVGFTGGLERQDSRVSGVVRLRKKIDAHVGETTDVTALAYNNFDWRQATHDVLALAREIRDEAGVGARVAPPVVVVYGHSWGGGAITKFARALRHEGLDVALAVYIDAFTLRTPRVPDNVRYAVNIYQRTGIFRGLPLRGKNRVIAESPDDTVILANLRIKPDTEHFGWNWNLVQPLLYRHHHRIGHDVRIQRFLLDLVSVAPPAVEASTP
jgi:hypothetical protein